MDAIDVLFQCLIRGIGTMSGRHASIRDRISSVEFGVAIKSGMRLTYDQYDGIRHLLSFEYNEAARK